MADFKVTYEVNDGYVGGSRPQSFRIHEGDYEFSPDSTDEQLLEVFYGAIDEDMRQKVSPHNVNESDFLVWAREQIKAQV